MLRALSVTGCVLLAAVAHAENNLIMQHPLANLSASEMEKAIDYLVPADRQDAMRRSDKNIRSFLADYYTIKLMAEEARQQQLDQSGRVSFVVANYENRLLAEKLIENRLAEAKRPDYEKLAREAYKAKPELFVRPEQVKAQHILVEVNEERSESEALARAQQVYELVLKDKPGFAKLAKEYSDDPSAERNGGLLGFFDRTKMVPEFSEAAFALKPGEVSKPVKTSFGYHVIHVVERRPETKMPFERVRDKLIKEEEAKFLAAKRDEIVNSFRADDRVVFDEDVMVKFVEDMGKSVPYTGN